MKKAVLPLIILTSLLSACNSNTEISSDKKEGVSDLSVKDFIVKPDAKVIKGSQLSTKELEVARKDKNIKIEWQAGTGNNTITFYEVDGQAIIGDMILGNVDKFKSDMANQGSMTPQGHKYTNRAWPYSSIYYETIGNNFTSFEKDMIKAALNAISNNTNVNFYEYSGASDRIVFTKSSSCYSTYGYQGGIHYVNLTSACAQSQWSVQHELLHVIGLAHEHQRCDRDNYITVYSNNLNSSGMTDIYQKLCSWNFSMSWGDYDINSNTHYSSYPIAFTIDPSQPAMKTIYGGTIGYGYLSSGDIQAVNSMYW